MIGKEHLLSHWRARERRSVATVVVGLGLTVGAGAACQPSTGSQSPTVVPDEQLVELFSWWSAPGEADALEALIDAHQVRHPGARIFNAAAASGSKARAWLDERLINKEPPDIFQEYVHDLRAVPGQAAGKRVPLDDMFDRLGLRDVVFPEILRNVTTDGHIYSMPVNIHRENALFYNRRLFAAHHLAPPSTLAGFLAACRKLKAEGVIPVATANEGWILRIMFNSLAMGSMGGARYRDYFMGQEGVGADVAGLRSAIDVFAEVVESYVNPDAGDEGFSWTNAAQAVFNGDAAMLLHGDWSKGYFVQLGWSGETDFGVVGAPGASEVFLYGVDAFALAVGARNDAGARSFLETVASPAGQVAFNRVKGSSPIRPDVPRAELDLLGRETLADLEHAKIRMLVRSRPVWEDALAAFTRDHDRAKLLRAFVDFPPGP
jgi:glucose/mannose transport system substrate-binding protein